MRLFVAVTLPPALQDQLAEIQRQLRQTRADVKWVEPHQMHLTLKFLGETADDRLAGLCEALDQAARMLQAFAVTWGGLGRFPPSGVPRVIWAGTQAGGDQLREAARHVDEALAGLGFAREAREFQGHLTLGRVRSPRGVRELTEAMEGLTLPSFAPVTVDAVTLFQSTLTPQGPLYTALHTARLRP